MGAHPRAKRREPCDGLTLAWVFSDRHMGSFGKNGVWCSRLVRYFRGERRREGLALPHALEALQVEHGPARLAWMSNRVTVMSRAAG
jgi:hypothetical protein